MAREIDLEQKLSAEDVEYLYARNRWRDVLDNYNRFGGDYEVQVPTDAPVTGPESLINAAGLDALTPEQQAEYQNRAGEESDDADEVDYNDMTVAELKSELDGRKAEAVTDDEKANLEYKTSDNKQALVDRLDRDDQLVAGRE